MIDRYFNGVEILYKNISKILKLTLLLILLLTKLPISLRKDIYGGF